MKRKNQRKKQPPNNRIRKVRSATAVAEPPKPPAEALKNGAAEVSAKAVTTPEDASVTETTVEVPEERQDEDIESQAEMEEAAEELKGPVPCTPVQVVAIQANIYKQALDKERDRVDEIEERLADVQAENAELRKELVRLRKFEREVDILPKENKQLNALNISVGIGDGNFSRDQKTGLWFLEKN